MRPDVTRAGRRPLLALIAANGTLQVGNMMTAVAVPWFVLDIAGGATQVGIVSAAVAIGAVGPAVLGGPLVDRLGLVRTSIGADVVSGLTVGLIPILHVAGVLQFWMLPILVFVLASVNAQGDTARLALLPILARQAGVAPERSNAIDRAAARTGQLVGPILAGILIALIGPSNVLFVNVATFTAAAVILGVFVRTPADQGGGGDAIPTSQGYRGDLLEGLRFVARDRLLVGMVLLASLGNFLDVPLMQVVLPVYASEVFASPTALGLLMGAFAGGALLGTVGFGLLGVRLPRRRTFLLSWLLSTAVIYGGLVLRLPLPLLVLTGLIGGLLSGPINPIILTVVQAVTPQHLMGRVFGAVTAIAQAGIPFGAATVGLLIDGAGLVETIAGMGLLYAATILVMFTIPALHRMDALVEPVPAAVPVGLEIESAHQARLCATMKTGL